MLGPVLCRLWAHRWRFMFTNDAGRAVFHCTRCLKVQADKP
jgi:hypothetical protein